MDLFDVYYWDWWWDWRWDWFNPSENVSKINCNPSWKPLNLDINNDNLTKNDEIYQKCNNCFQNKKVVQYCSYRGNVFVFCSAMCWDNWINNPNIQYSNNKKLTSDFFIE